MVQFGFQFHVIMSNTFSKMCYVYVFKKRKSWHDNSLLMELLIVINFTFFKITKKKSPLIFKAIYLWCPTHFSHTPLFAKKWRKKKQPIALSVWVETFHRNGSYTFTQTQASERKWVRKRERVSETASERREREGGRQKMQQQNILPIFAQ